MVRSLKTRISKRPYDRPLEKSSRAKKKLYLDDNLPHSSSQAEYSHADEGSVVSYAGRATTSAQSEGRTVNMYPSFSSHQHEGVAREDEAQEAIEMEGEEEQEEEEEGWDAYECLYCSFQGTWDEMNEHRYTSPCRPRTDLGICPSLHIDNSYMKPEYDEARLTTATSDRARDDEGDDDLYEDLYEKSGEKVDTTEEQNHERNAASPVVGHVEEESNNGGMDRITPHSHHSRSRSASPVAPFADEEVQRIDTPAMADRNPPHPFSFDPLPHYRPRNVGPSSSRLDDGPRFPVEWTTDPGWYRNHPSSLPPLYLHFNPPYHTGPPDQVTRYTRPDGGLVVQLHYPPPPPENATIQNFRPPISDLRSFPPRLAGYPGRRGRGQEDVDTGHLSVEGDVEGSDDEEVEKDGQGDS